MAIDTNFSDDIKQNQILQIWFSSSFPIGSFAYSHGLESMIDNKLSRSLFPEIKKIFYFDVEYRELYKICSYNSETNGRFAAHRDTPYPHQHRKFALSLILNFLKNKTFDLILL